MASTTASSETHERIQNASGPVCAARHFEMPQQDSRAQLATAREGRRTNMCVIVVHVRTIKLSLAMK